MGLRGNFSAKIDTEINKVFAACSNAGALPTKKDCARFLMQAGYAFEEKTLKKSSTPAILTRSLKNLIAVYNKLNESVKASRFSRFIEILDGAKKGECGTGA